MPVDADNKTDELISSTAHGFAVWDVLRETARQVFAKAQANSAANADIRKLALVVEVPDVNSYRVLYLRGVRVKLETGHGVGASFGQVLYLSPSTAGLLTVTKPTASPDVVAALGYRRAADEIIWHPDPFVFAPEEAP